MNVIIMVIIICFGATCQTMNVKGTYGTYDSCISGSKGVADYMKDTFPTSSGEIYCMTEQEFEDYQDEYGKSQEIPKVVQSPSNNSV
jgi:hypothetical protein